MDKIIWCLEQKKGLELVEPSKNLQLAFILKAEESLETLRTTKSASWQMIIAYYVIYNSLYSLLMRIGVKSEIHSCSIEFVKTYLKKWFSSQDIALIEKSFTSRIDSQYYVNREILTEDVDFILKNVSSFLVRCKHVVLETKDIDAIRTALRSKKSA